MVPTLPGRIQTRLFLLAILGAPLTLIITPFLGLDGPLLDRYQVTFTVLLAVAVIGIVWEAIYHFLMQWRWEKDWPTLFGLITFLPEGLLIWGLFDLGLLPGLPASAPVIPFALHFLAVWLVVWLAANGPMRVPFIRWRFYGGRLL